MRVTISRDKKKKKWVQFCMIVSCGIDSEKVKKKQV
jgi:hypothetical protein